VSEVERAIGVALLYAMSGMGVIAAALSLLDGPNVFTAVFAGLSLLTGLLARAVDP
jgi:hypothetical protein